MYICEICGESILDRSNFRKHVMRHKGKTFDCKHCQYKCKTPTQLKRHRQHRDNPLKFKCPFCCYTYQGAATLKNHIFGGHPEKPQTVVHTMTETETRMENDDNDPDVIPPTQIPTLSTSKHVSNNYKRKEENTEATIKKKAKHQGSASKFFPTQGQIHTESESFPVTSTPDENADDDLDCDMFEQLQSESQLPISPITQELAQVSPTCDLIFDADFILRVWRLTNNKDKFVNFLNNPMDGKMKKMLLEALGSQLEIKTADQVFKFLECRPIDHVGPLVMSLIILELILALPWAEIIIILVKKDTLPTELQKLVYKWIAVILQNRLAGELDNPIVLQQIPSNVSHSLDFKTATFSKFFPDQNFFIEAELQNLADVRALLFDIIYDKQQRGLSLVDDSFPGRQLAWSHIINDYVNPDSNRKKSIFLTILDRDRYSGRGVCPIFYIGHADNKIYAHKEVLQKYTDMCITTDMEQELAGMYTMAANTLLDLFYQRWDFTVYKGKLNFKVYELAVKVEIEDIYKFMFNDKPYEDFLDDGNAMDMLKILTCLLRDEDIQKFVNELNRWIPRDQKTKILNGLHPCRVTYFFGKVKLSQDQVYKTLIQWAFHAAGRECIDELRAPFFEDVKKQFDMVKKNIKICGLLKILGNAANNLSYISHQEVVIAHISTLRRHVTNLEPVPFSLDED